RDATVTGVQTCALPILRLCLGEEDTGLIDVYVNGRCCCRYCGFGGTAFEHWRSLDIDHNSRALEVSITGMDKVASCQACNRAEEIGRASCRERMEGGWG